MHTALPFIGLWFATSKSALQSESADRELCAKYVRAVIGRSAVGSSRTGLGTGSGSRVAGSVRRRAMANLMGSVSETDCDGASTETTGSDSEAGGNDDSEPDRKSVF
jgi:hypothetical protein